MEDKLEGSGDGHAALPEGFALIRERDGLALRAPGGLVLRIDFGSPAMRRRIRSSWRDEALLRAVGRRQGKAPTVLDATGGIGRDAFVLAAHGCRVILCEENPVLAAMLEDALARAAGFPETAAARITLMAADSIAVMKKLGPEERPDAVYLDPMYPEKRKRALSGKEMQILQQLCGPSRDEELFHAALAAAAARVAVKRPKSAPPMCGRGPDFSVRGPAHRFDIYLTAGRKQKAEVR